MDGLALHTQPTKISIHTDPIPHTLQNQIVHTQISDQEPERDEMMTDPYSHPQQQPNIIQQRDEMLENGTEVLQQNQLTEVALTQQNEDLMAEKKQIVLQKNDTLQHQKQQIVEREEIVENPNNSETEVFVSQQTGFFGQQDLAKVEDQAKYQGNNPMPQKQEKPVVEKNKQEVIADGQEENLQFSSPIAIHKMFEWCEDQAIIVDFILRLGSKDIPIRQITKVKCLSEESLAGKHKLKITSNEVEETFFGAEVSKFKLGFPLQYTWFAKIICNKLTNMGLDIYKPYQSENKDFGMEIPGCYCKGMLLKRSQHLKRWDARFIAITPEGLFSYRNPNQTPSFTIKAVNAKYIWTRFQIHNQQLVIKIKHGLEQTQFAIPIHNYFWKSSNNWLYGFYRMIMERNIPTQLH